MKKILSLEIQKSPFFKDNLKIEFSEKLSCIMGGRGTGKSTILQFIRSCIDPTAEEQKDTYSVLKSNLGNGLLILHVTDDSGEIYRIEKLLGEEPQPYLMSSGKHVPINLIKWKLLADIFPAQYIEEIGRNNEARLSLIDNMLPDIITDALEKIRVAQNLLMKNAADILNDNIRLQRINDILIDFSTSEEDLKKLKMQQPDSIPNEDSLEFERQDAAEKKRSAEQRFLSKQLLLFKSYSSNFKDLKTETEDLIKTIEAITDFEEDQPFLPILSTIQKTYELILKRTTENIADIENCNVELISFQEQIIKLHNDENNQFIQLKQKLDKNRVYFDLLNALSKRVEQKNILQKEYEEILTNRKKIKELRAKTLIELNREKARILEARLKKVEELNSLFDGRVKITLTPGGIKQQYEETLRNAFKGHNMRYNTIIPYLINNFTPDKFAKIIHDNDIESLKNTSGIDSERASAVMRVLHESEDIYRIETIYCPDLPDFHLKVENEDNSTETKRDGYKRSDELSTGQRCTTVLPIIFSISENPLIIDQPEDNLDNKYISETIHKIIKHQKEVRQLILITHNANIPVLSNSEKNIFLKYDDKQSQVQAEGTVEEVQELILNLLEGGKQAFEERKKLYGY